MIQTTRFRKTSQDSQLPDPLRSNSAEPSKKRSLLSRIFNSQNESQQSNPPATPAKAGSSSPESGTLKKPGRRATSTPKTTDADPEPETARPSLSARILSLFGSKTQPQNYCTNGAKTGAGRVKLDPAKLLQAMRPTYYMKNLEFLFQVKDDTSLSTMYKQSFHNNWINLRFGKEIIKAARRRLSEMPHPVGLPSELGRVGSEGYLPCPLTAPPPNTRPLTVVFDLDGTLVSCCDKRQGDFAVTISYKHRKIQANFFLRPHALAVLASLASKHEVILFSSSHRSYVQAVAKHLDPQGTIFSRVYDRQHCVAAGDSFVKHLGILNRDLRRVVIVDDNAKSYLLNLDNAVPIVPYLEGQEDIELMTLETYIDWLARADDVRPANTRYFGWEQYMAAKSLYELYQLLFRK